MALNDAEVARYARQLILPAMGEEAQERLRGARVRVVGGGLASLPAVYYLAAAGVGTIWVDDPDAIAPGDGAGWAFGPADVGRPRGAATAEFAASANGLVKADVFRPGSRPTALLVCGATSDVSRAIAEEARLLQLPHVVADVDGQGGSATTVPVGAPCYACATRPGLGAAPTPEGGAAVGALAALELVLLLSGASVEPAARRIEIFRGTPLTRATSRQAGCACNAASPGVATSP
jgi:adenylyltransferase/sulfurtransferase